MIKSCENCKKQATCRQTIGYIFGFCETDFEPIEAITRYRGYDIEYNVYGQKELSVQYCGDDFMFKTMEEARAFIRSITGGENA